MYIFLSQPLTVNVHAEIPTKISIYPTLVKVLMFKGDGEVLLQDGHQGLRHQLQHWLHVNAGFKRGQWLCWQPKRHRWNLKRDGLMEI